MADVYRAYDRHEGRDVAIKVMRPALAGDTELLGRFERETSVVGTLHHPSIVEIYGHGTDDGAPFIVMELVDGPTLQQVIRERAPLADREVRRIGERIADALAAAHETGVVHRDLKPANILMTADGTPKVSDFGIAHLESMTQLTRTGEVLGTPRYISPEQIEGRVDARSDVYGLGIVLYELLTGRPPFDGGSSVEIVRKQLRERPVPPSALVPSVSRDLERVILRALHKDPARRFPSSAAMRDALRPPESSPVTAMVARGGHPAVARRVAAAIPVAIVAMLLLAGAALARLGDPSLSAADRPASPTVAASSPAAASSPPVPTASPTAAPTAAATDAPTPEPTATPPPRTAAPTVVPGAVPAVARAAEDPRSTVALFYQLVSAHRYDEAAALWSDRMKAAYPPSTNIAGRFDRTTSITVRSSSIASETTTSAAVNVDVVEVLTDGTTREWVGQWFLVRSGSGWLMDAPALARA